MAHTVHPLAFKTLHLAMNPENTMSQLLKLLLKILCVQFTSMPLQVISLPST